MVIRWDHDLCTFVYVGYIKRWAVRLLAELAAGRTGCVGRNVKGLAKLLVANYLGRLRRAITTAQNSGHFYRKIVVFKFKMHVSPSLHSYVPQFFP